MGRARKPELSSYYERLGGLLRSARRSRDQTQVQLAESLGRKQAFVARIENGNRGLDVIEFVQYAHAIGVSPVRVLRRLEREMRPVTKARQGENRAEGDAAGSPLSIDANAGAKL